MSMLMAVISREGSRNENMIIEYTREFDTLLRGKITPKSVNGKTYYYLYNRDEKRFLFKRCEKAMI